MGEWIPEPLPEPTEWISGRSDATTIDPAERVAFILHDVFRYSFAEVGTAIADGGGIVGAVLHPIEGAEQIGRPLIHLEGRLRNLTILERTVNGQPGLIAQQDGVTVSVYAFEVEGDRIKRIWAVRRPDKLRPWTAPRPGARGRAGSA